MHVVKPGATLQAHGAPITAVYFPNGGVFSITNQMHDGALVEVGDSWMGRDVSPAVAQFVNETAMPGPFRNVVARYAQANLLQTMQCTACYALHDVKQRCCRWLLQTHDLVGADEFALKQEFLAVMLAVRRPTVSVVMRSLQQVGLISSRYGRIRILKRKRLEHAACECTP